MEQQLWQGGAWERPAQPVQPLVLPEVKNRPGRRERRRRRNWIVFGVCLGLIVVLTAAAAVWSDLDFSVTPPSWNYEDDVPAAYAEDVGETTIPRGGVTSDVRLELQPASEQVLTPQEIYARCSSAIVYIQARYPSGRGSAGSGVVMTGDGYIITNAHVIAGAQQAQVVFQDNTVMEAVLVGAHADYDLAVLKVEGADLPCAQFASSTQLSVGDTVVALGNPLGSRLRGTMTEGIVSAIDRSVDLDGVTMSLIQTTAALNPGNSGGALINDRGQVVGITTMKMMSRYDTIEGLGFAVPTRLAKGVVDQLIATGEAKTPALGIVVMFDRTKYGGLYVTAVNKNSDAWQKGLRADDVIVAVNGIAVTDDSVLVTAKEELGVGGSLLLTVEREGERLEFEIELMDAKLFEETEN